MPESFRVLVKELQALGLDMKVLDSYKQEIELREMDDDDDEVINVDALSKYAKEQADKKAEEAQESKDSETEQKS